MEKYQRHDLKVTKGDLDGLSPYLVAQITSVATSGKGGARPHAYESRVHARHTAARAACMGSRSCQCMTCASSGVANWRDLFL
jgi:hypothetical protein